LQDTIQQLVEERYNQFVSTADVSMLDLLYRADLPPGVEFQGTEQSDGTIDYNVPQVWATISGTEYEITIAERNNIRTLWYEALPSRIEYGQETVGYAEVIPRTEVANIVSLTPNPLPIDGHLWVTLRDNTSWFQQWGDKIFYSKCRIRGTTRKGITTEEVVPLRHNHTFKTLNQFKAVSDIFVSYLSDDAELTVETLPFDAESELDLRNINVVSDLTERMRFVRLGTFGSGSTLIAESYTTDNLDIVRLGHPEKDSEYEIELLDDDSLNVTLAGYALKANTDYLFAIDATKLYVYDINLTYPTVSGVARQSPESRMDLISDKWVYVRGSTATIKTHILDVVNVPRYTRWKLTTPTGAEYYIDEAEALQPLTADTWIENNAWERHGWHEVSMNILLDTVGTYVVEIECQYINEQTYEVTTLTSKMLLLVPAITPEISLDLPAELQNGSDIKFDSDGRLWILKGNSIYLANLYYDYFIADYDNKRVWLREQYSSVRVQT
jgi:hypothetical protein